MEEKQPTRGNTIMAKYNHKTDSDKEIQAGIANELNRIADILERIVGNNIPTNDEQRSNPTKLDILKGTIDKVVPKKDPNKLDKNSLFSA